MEAERFVRQKFWEVSTGRTLWIVEDMDDLPFAYAGVQGVAEVVDVVLLTTFINCGPSVWSRFVFFFYLL